MPGARCHFMHELSVPQAASTRGPASPVGVAPANVTKQNFRNCPRCPPYIFISWPSVDHRACSNSVPGAWACLASRDSNWRSASQPVEISVTGCVHSFWRESFEDQILCFMFLPKQVFLVPRYCTRMGGRNEPWNEPREVL